MIDVKRVVVGKKTIVRRLTGDRLDQLDQRRHPLIVGVVRVNVGLGSLGDLLAFRVVMQVIADKLA